MQALDRMNDTDAFSWMQPPDDPLPCPERVLDCDVVIIGAGQAGTAAARAAAEDGSRVIVLEQQPRDKQFILGVGEIGHINSRWQESLGIPKVDVDEFVTDWQLRTGNRSNVRLIRTYANGCGEAFDWMIEVLRPDERAQIRPMLWPASDRMPQALDGLRAWPGSAHMPVPLYQELTRRNHALAEALGAQFLFRTRALRLVETAGRVTGVLARDAAGGIIQVNAAAGVVLAAGGYSSNRRMCIDLLTEAADLLDAQTDWQGHGWDGSGIQMGVWAGGRLEPRSHAAMGGNYSLPGFETVGSTPVLRVNRHGRRYSNEGFATHVLAALAGARQPNGMLWGVFDSTIREQLHLQTPCHAVADYTDVKRMESLERCLERAIAAGPQGVTVGAISRDAGAEHRYRVLYAADTIKDLAASMFDEASDRNAFLETVARYNELCVLGRDGDFGKDPRLMVPVAKPPFFAHGQLKSSHCPLGQSFKLLVTVSGLLIDECQRVLGDEYEPIPGLYATGNSSGCRFGFQYTTSLPGQSISIAHTLGRDLGTRLARGDV